MLPTSSESRSPPPGPRRARTVLRGGRATLQDHACPGLRRRTAPVVLAALLCLPHTAYPWTLERLLRMPLQQLMQLRISAPVMVGSPAALRCDSPCTAASRRAP